MRCLVFNTARVGGLGRRLAATVLALGASAAEATLPVYASVGKSGRVVYTNEPIDDSSRRVELVWAAGHAVRAGVVPTSYAPSSSRGRVDLSPAYASALPQAEIRALAAATARRFNVDEHLVLAVIEVESGFNPRAVSHAGASGLMQLVPATAARFGVRQVFDPVQNLEGGVRYLRWLLDTFNNNTRLALAAYNAGEGAVMRYGYRIPPFDETQRYVPAVLAVWERNRRRSAP